MSNMFVLKNLSGGDVINFIGTYESWTPLQHEGNIVTKLPFANKRMDGTDAFPLVDVLGVTGTISLEAYCLSSDAGKVDKHRYKEAFFTDPYGTYHVYVRKINFNQKEVPNLENVGLEVLVLRKVA